jgi:methylenetetrahydrofolate reductase (NADPH)
MTALASIAELVSFLSSASVEISSHGHQLKELCDNFALGTTVTIMFLPGDNYRHNVETAAVLRRLGFNPLPHIAARELAPHEALDDFLTRLRGEADVKRMLLIGATWSRPKGRTDRAAIWR